MGAGGFFFTILTAFAGAAMVQAKSYHVGWSAIAFSAVLNVVQVSIGLTLFGPFREAASQLEALGPLAGGRRSLVLYDLLRSKALARLCCTHFWSCKDGWGCQGIGRLDCAGWRCCYVRQCDFDCVWA